MGGIYESKNHELIHKKDKEVIPASLGSINYKLSGKAIFPICVHL